MNLKINYENKKSLEILKSLIKLNYKFQTKFGKINIANIFLIELYKYLDSSIKSIIYKSEVKKNFFFPFVDYKYLNKNLNLNLNLKKNLDIPFPKDHEIGKIINSYKINFYKILNFNISEQNKYYFNNNSFHKSKRIFFQKIFIKDKEIQLALINKFLKDFAKINKISNEYYSINFINYINMFIADTPKIILRKNIKLLVGSNQNIFNRIMSANFISQNSKVISFAHAKYSSSIYDDPINDIGEYFLCNEYIESGNIKFHRKYLKKKSTIPKIKKISQRVKIQNFSNKDLNNYIYIPDSYNSFRRFGLYRNINDHEYINLQKKIVNSKKNIYFKSHPKQKFNYNIFKKKIYIDGYLNFKKVYKVYIFDSISQSFFEIAKTNLKILYLHIPIRKLNSKTLNMIKKRALVKYINPKKIKKNQLSNFINEAENFKIKNYDLIKYCM